MFQFFAGLFHQKVGGLSGLRQFIVSGIVEPNGIEGDLLSGKTDRQSRRNGRIEPAGKKDPEGGIGCQRALYGRRHEVRQFGTGIRIGNIPFMKIRRVPAVNG